MNSLIQIQSLKFSPLIMEEEIHTVVKRLAEQISKDYKGREVLIIGVLNGAMVFMADLIREINIPLTINFIKVSSYVGTKSTGNISIEKNQEINIAGKHVLLVEDILDTGNTLHKLLESLHKQGPASLSTVTLLFKPTELKHNVRPNYVGFEIPSIFVVGYGMDYNEEGRNLKHIYAIKH